MKTVYMFDRETLVGLAESAARAPRRQAIPVERIPPGDGWRFPVNHSEPRRRDGVNEVRMCVVLHAPTGLTAWLDVSAEEFASLPQVEVNELEWEAIHCAGTPPMPD